MDLAKLQSQITTQELDWLLPVLIAAHYASGGDSLSTTEEFLALPEVRSLMPEVIQHLRDGRKFWVPMLVGNHLRDARGVVFLPTYTGGQQVVSLAAELHIRRKWPKRKRPPTSRS
jgi:hypothetical protein